MISPIATQPCVTIGYTHYEDSTRLTPVTPNRQIRFELNYSLSQLQIFIDLVYQGSVTQIQTIHPNRVTFVNVSHPAQSRVLGVIPFIEQASIITSLSPSNFVSVISTPQTSHKNGHYEKISDVFITA